MIDSLTIALKRKSWVPMPSGMFGLCLMLIFLFTQGSKLLVDGNTYTHLFIGQWIIEHLDFPNTSLLSHTLTESTVTIQGWGADVLMGLAYRHCGLAGVAILYSLLIGLLFMVLFRVLETLDIGPWIAIPMMTGTLLLLYPMLVAQPYVFSWLLGSLTFLVLCTNRRYLWTLPLIMLCWVNLHDGFALGIALQLIFIIGRILEKWDTAHRFDTIWNQKRELVILFLSLAVIGGNPYGYGILQISFDSSLASLALNDPAWKSPNLSTFLAFRLYLAILLFGLLLRKTSLRWTHLLLLLFSLEAALSCRSHVFVVAIVLLPIWRDILEPLQNRLSKFTERLKRGAGDLRLSAWSGLLFTLCLTLLLLISARVSLRGEEQLLQSFFPVSRHFPQQAWSYIMEQRPPGQIFNEYNWGAYLVYQSHGTVPVFIDGLLHRNADKVNQDYHKIVGLKAGCEDILDEYDVNWILFPTQAPLVRYLLVSGEWHSAYQDNQATVLQRITPLDSPASPSS